MSLRPHKKTYSVLIALLMGASASQPVAALDFNQCLDLALKQNPQMLLAHARQAEAKGAVSVARGHLLPSLAASFSASQSNNALTVFNRGVTTILAPGCNWRFRSGLAGQPGDV